MAVMIHISSLAPLTFALLNSQPSAEPCIAAHLSVGDQRAEGFSTPQFGLRDAGSEPTYGRLTWDADHLLNGDSSPFFGVATVRLDVKSNGDCLLAVGTSDFVRLQARPYRWIEAVRLGAIAGTGAPGRSIQWDLIELAFCYGDGRVQTCRSNCLPSVTSGARVRRSSQAPGRLADRFPRQFAEVATGSQDVVGVKLRGQVTLRANEAHDVAFPLRPQDLQAHVEVFTDAASR
jgi:hypothetical protein